MLSFIMSKNEVKLASRKIKLESTSKSYFMWFHWFLISPDIRINVVSSENRFFSLLSFLKRLLWSKCSQSPRFSIYVKIPNHVFKQNCKIYWTFFLFHPLNRNILWCKIFSLWSYLISHSSTIDIGLISTIIAQKRTYRLFYEFKAMGELWT